MMGLTAYNEGDIYTEDRLVAGFELPVAKFGLCGLWVVIDDVGG